MEPRQCRKCGHPTPPAIGRGRPRTYCSSRCKRAVEYESRHLRRRLAALDHLLGQARAYTWGDDAKLTAERRAVAERLAELTNDDYERTRDAKH